MTAPSPCIQVGIIIPVHGQAARSQLHSGESPLNRNASDQTALPVLYQFRLSMYPEKARWALDYKRVAHVRHNLLPGPHIPFMLRRFGQKSTPALTAGEVTLTSSNAILEWLEAEHPQPPLYPQDAAQRKAVQAMIERYDEWGVHVRRALFHDLLADADYAGEAFAQGVSGWRQRAYRLAFPLTRIAMRKDMDISAASAKASMAQVQYAMDYTAEQVADTGYLVGDQFTAADLTAATCLHCVCAPAEYPAVYREPKSARHQAFLDRWASHPATGWVQRMYREHRGSSSAVRNID